MIRRFNQTQAQRIDFTSAAPIDFKYGEYAAFAQDRWILNPRLTFDYGLRFDRDGVTKRNNLAPRFSFLYVPAKNQRTAIRGGVGIFYDRSLSTAGYFDRPPNGAIEQIPQRVVTNFAADGITVVEPPRFFSNQIVEPLRTPRSVRYSLSVDRGITKDLTARAGFLERFTKNDLLIEPVTGSNGASALQLDSRGRSRYEEFQLLLVYNKPRIGQINFSYVFSRSRGDLNTADRFLTDTPNFVVRPNEYGKLPFDAPHRFLIYGQFDVSKKYDIRIAPLFELRSGFPFSAVNEQLDFVGRRNEAGRLPTYLSLDLQVTKGFNLPFFDNKRARIGIALFNLTNHFNPRDVQINTASPNFGKFYNSLGTSVKAKFEIDF